MCEKVKKIMAIVIDCCITKEDAMEVLRVKYDWLYPYITEAVWSEHYSLYMKSKGFIPKYQNKMSSICEIQSNQLCRECQDKPILRGESLCEDCWSADYDREDDEYCCCCRNPDEGLDGGCKCDCHTEIDTDDEGSTTNDDDCYDEDMCDKCSKGLKMPNKYGSCECVCKCGELFWECRYKCDIINLYKPV